jgi:hypothetical protein
MQAPKTNERVIEGNIGRRSCPRLLEEIKRRRKINHPSSHFES